VYFSNLYQDELLALKNEIGILPGKTMYILILRDDILHYQITVNFDLLPYFGESSEILMMETHTNGAAILQVSEYQELKKIQDDLRQKNYNIIINRKESDSD
jgi:ATP-dependent Clp protease adapter protein ClpS